ncbi:MAG: hypothetical protein AAB602_02840 [Patescibacteria group bacterium]
MLIFLYGQDDYRREEKRRSIKEEFLKKYSSLSIGSFDLLEGGGFEEFKNFVRSQSIFEAKKIVFLENAFEIETPDALVKELVSFLKNKDTTIVLSESGKPAKAFASLLEKPALAQEFRQLEGKDWEKFIFDTAKKYNVVLDAPALEFLARVYNGNSWGLVTEIQKLSLLGKKGITKADLEGTMIETVPDFWAIFNGLKNSDITRRLFVLEKLFAAHEPAAKIFNILASLSKDRVSDFAEYDLKVKSGKLEYEEALVYAVLG